MPALKLLGILLAVLTQSPTPLAACTPTSATLQFAGDDNSSLYLNGTFLASCSACWSGVVSVGLSAGQMAAFVSGGDNVLAVYATDTGGKVSGATWSLSIATSDCGTLLVRSDGGCTVSFYAGNAVSGSPPVSFPGGWSSPGYSDAAWQGVYASTSLPPGSGWASIGGPVPWIWGANSFFTVNQGDGYLFRQHFSLDGAACPISPPPSPTAWASPTVTLTRTPTPPPSPTPSATPSRTPYFSPTITETPAPLSCVPAFVAGSASKFNGNSNAFSQAYSAGAGSNTVLVVKVLMDSAANIASMSYGGTALSRVVRQAVTGADLEIWILASPPSGSHTLAAAWGGSYYNYNLAAETFSGVDQASPTGALAFKEDTGCPTSFSASLSTTAPGSLITDFVAVGTLPSWTLGPGQGLEFAQSAGSPKQMYGDSRLAGAAGAYTMAYSAYGYCVSTADESLELKAASCSPPSPTVTPTFTPTPFLSPTITPGMPLVKTVDRSVAMLGDTVTFCLAWTNDSQSSVPMLLWDTLAVQLSYAGCDHGCSVSGQLVSWNLGSVPPGASGQVCTWVVVSALP